MANPITQIEHHLLHSTLRVLEGAGGTTDHADWMREGKEGAHAKLLVQFIDQQRGILELNPFTMSIGEQIAALRRANEEEKWGITDEVFTHLVSIAPMWPKGKHAYRSFRIRFGEGDDGVALTFERHVACIKSVFTEKGFWRWEHLHSGAVPYEGEPVERLRLLNGNHTHHACVEWVVVDLDTHRQRESVEAVRGLSSLADELLVIAWMFPEMIRAIDYDKLPGLFAGGYEVNGPERVGGAWQRVVVVSFTRHGQQVHVLAHHRGVAGSGYSVPSSRGQKVLGT